MDVVYGGGFKDKTLRELIILERNGNLFVRRIRRKFTSTPEFKEKYPEALVVDYTRNQHKLLNWIKLIDWEVTNPTSCPMPTFLFEGKRYYFNRVSGQWWDLPTNKYWNGRLSDLFNYDNDRKLKAELKVDHTWKQVHLTITQNVVDTPLQNCNICVFRNNELLLREDFPFAEGNLQYQNAEGVTKVDLVRVISGEVNRNPHDIYCILVNGKASFYDHHGRINLYPSIPKFLLFGMEEYEKKLGEPYKFKDLVFG